MLKVHSIDFNSELLMSTNIYNPKKYKDSKKVIEHNLKLLLSVVTL